MCKSQSGFQDFKLLPRGYRGPEPASEARTVDGNGDEGDGDDCDDGDDGDCDGDDDDAHDNDNNNDLELWEEER